MPPWLSDLIPDSRSLIENNDIVSFMLIKTAFSAFFKAILQGGQGMKRYMTAVSIAVLCVCLLCTHQVMTGQAQVKDKGPIITVLNPMGSPPPLELKAMAPRLDTIKGKTLYLVDDGYPGSDLMLKELEKGLNETYPDTTFHYVKKQTFMSQKDPALWEEMREKADAMILALGH
jgi:hypothetical protein